MANLLEIEVNSSVATEFIPAYSAVIVDEDGAIGTINEGDEAIMLLGFTTKDVQIGEAFVVVVRGLIENPEWNFSNLGGKAFLGVNGQVTEEVPQQGSLQITLGVIISNNSFQLSNTGYSIRLRRG